MVLTCAPFRVHDTREKERERGERRAGERERGREPSQSGRRVASSCGKGRQGKER